MTTPPPRPGRSHDTPPAPRGPDIPDPATLCFPDLASLAALFDHPAADRTRRAAAVVHAIDVLRIMPLPEPQLTDAIARWLAPRAVRSLRARHVDTLADLTLRVPRRRRWWRAIPGLGVTGARHIEAFFAAHPALTARAWQLVIRVQENQIKHDHPDAVLHDTPLVPWEQLRLPAALDGSHGRFRAPASTCLLDASNDYAAVQSWLALHESPDTRRAYRKEAERLILWALVERQCAFSSLTTDDAVAYRAFLRRPAPRARWTGPSCPRTCPDWRPFVRGLSARSAAYALSVLRALFRWLIEQRYVLANPFAGIRVRGAGRLAPLDGTRVLTGSEWSLVRSIADRLEASYGRSTPAAQRLRFLLDLDYATGLRAHELVTVTHRGHPCRCARRHVADRDGQGRADGQGGPAPAGARAVAPAAQAAGDAHALETGHAAGRNTGRRRCSARHGGYHRHTPAAGDATLLCAGGRARSGRPPCPRGKAAACQSTLDAALYPLPDYVGLAV